MRRNDIPAFRQISSTLVPSSNGLRINAICCSVNLDLFMAKILGSPGAKPNREFLIKNEPNFRDQVKRFAQQLRASGFSPHIIGDAAGVGFVEGAMRSAATVARAL